MALTSKKAILPKVCNSIQYQLVGKLQQQNMSKMLMMWHDNLKIHKLENTTFLKGKNVEQYLTL